MLSQFSTHDDHTKTNLNRIKHRRMMLIKQVVWHIRTFVICRWENKRISVWQKQKNKCEIAIHGRSKSHQRCSHRKSRLNFGGSKKAYLRIPSFRTTATWTNHSLRCQSLWGYVRERFVNVIRYNYIVLKCLWEVWDFHVEIHQVFFLGMEFNWDIQKYINEVVVMFSDF